MLRLSVYCRVMGYARCLTSVTTRWLDGLIGRRWWWLHDQRYASARRITVASRGNYACHCHFNASRLTRIIFPMHLFKFGWEKPQSVHWLQNLKREFKYACAGIFAKRAANNGFEGEIFQELFRHDIYIKIKFLSFRGNKRHLERRKDRYALKKIKNFEE